jgi:hypothetical protein
MSIVTSSRHFAFAVIMDNVIVICMPMSARDRDDGLVSRRGLTNMRAGRNEWVHK